MLTLKSSRLKWTTTLALGGCLAITGCAETPDASSADEPAAQAVESESTTEAELSAQNGLRGINGLSSSNGLDSANGLRISNGLRGINGLSSTVGLMTSTAGRETVSYLVRCALAADQTLTKTDQNGVSYTFKGEIGIAPEWADGACGTACQEGVSACLLAHVNTTGQHISIWLDGNVDGIGWGQSTGHPYEEGSFFGNLFESPPRAYYCNGKDFDKGVVPGRLGANQANAPYTNAFNNQYQPSGKCADYCTPMDKPYEKDGYKACNGLNRVVTVWRNFDANTSYKICNRVSGRCLDAGGTSDGTNIVQNSYTGKTTQKWQIVQVNPKQYKVINRASGKAISVYKALTADRTPIVQSTYAGTAGQLWSFTSMANGTGYHALSPVSKSTSVLALPSSTSLGDNQAVQEFGWSATANHMQWSIGIAQ